MAKSEEQKLVDFFRSPEGENLGRQGDHDNLSPAETAIRAMRSLGHASEDTRRLDWLEDGNNIVVVGESRTVRQSIDAARKLEGE